MIKTFDRRIAYDQRGPITSGDRSPDAAAKAWLAERFPDHENPLAYWEDVR